MSTFRVAVLPIDEIGHHPNADRLSICRIRGYRAVTAKRPDGRHRFEVGQPIVYVPEGALLPERILRENNLWNADIGKGVLSGPLGNRVSPRALRGVLSQGILIDLPDGEAKIGDDYAERLGIEKYVPEVPAELLGQVSPLLEAKLGYDIESFLSFPDLLEGDEVTYTEKLHGICTQVTALPGLDDPELFGGGNVAITSKGLGDQGLVFRNVEANAGNPYVRTVTGLGLPQRLRGFASRWARDERVTVVGEIFGRGIQDLHYGAVKPVMRGFDIRIGENWLEEDDKVIVLNELGLERVPLLYRGAFDRQLADEMRSGKTTVGGSNIREGIVITAVGRQEKRFTDLGTAVRPQLKYHSPEYLTRKGGTEHR